MEIEQLPPKQPSFLLVVLLFGVTLLVVLVLAYLFISFDGRHLTFGRHHAHPTSQLTLPVQTAPSTFA